MGCSNRGGQCRFNIKTFGICDVSNITLNGSDRTQLNWSQLSVPEVVSVPVQKPDIEHLDQIYVNAKLNRVKLIETPFAYRSYERLATTLEVTAATAAATLAQINIGPIVRAVNLILAIPNLPSIPEVAALQAALDAVVAAAATLTTAVADALAALDADCISAALIVTLLTAILAALRVLRQALNVLVAAANALAAATVGIPVVGAAVAAAVTVLVAAVNVVQALITVAIEAITSVITLIGFTNAFEIIPNEEGACLSGRKLVIEGALSQKVVYTALNVKQSVHSFENCIPFNAYIIPYASFVGLTYQEGIEVIADPESPCDTILINGFLYDPNEPIVVNLCEEFNVNSCIEDIFAYAIDERNVFKNTTIFLSAKPAATC